MSADERPLLNIGQSPPVIIFRPLGSALLVSSVSFNVEASESTCTELSHAGSPFKRFRSPSSLSYVLSVKFFIFYVWANRAHMNLLVGIHIQS